MSFLMPTPAGRDKYSRVALLPPSHRLSIGLMFSLQLPALIGNYGSTTATLGGAATVAPNIRADGYKSTTAGTDYVEFPLPAGHPTYAIGKNFTASWSGVIGGSPPMNAILWGFRRISSNFALKAFLRFNSSNALTVVWQNSGGSEWGFIFSEIPATNEYAHWTVVRDGAGASLYKNGKLVSTASTGENGDVAWGNKDPLTFFNYYRTESTGSTGTIDSFSLWNRPLFRDEVYEYFDGARVQRRIYVPSAGGGVTGTSAGTFTVTGAAEADALVAGSSVGSFDLAGSGVAEVLVSASSAATITVTGAAAGVVSAAGIPVLSAATAVNITSTAATPRVTLTF